MFFINKQKLTGNELVELDKAKIVVESWKDIVIGFNGDPYRGRSRSVPSQKNDI